MFLPFSVIRNEIIHSDSGFLQLLNLLSVLCLLLLTICTVTKHYVKCRGDFFDIGGNVYHKFGFLLIENKMFLPFSVIRNEIIHTYLKSLCPTRLQLHSIFFLLYSNYSGVVS